MGFSDPRWAGDGGLEQSGQAPDSLRPLDWGALQARLSAAADLRRELGRSDEAQLRPASFHQPAARLLAMCQDDDRFVNHRRSVIGKAEGCISPLSPDAASSASASANPRTFELD